MNADPKLLAQIKAATRAAIHQIGGLEAAAMVCRAEKTALSEYQSINAPHRVVPLDVALQLDVALETPVILPALARMLGLSVVAPDAERAPALDSAVAAMLNGAGQAGAAWVTAQADGVLDAGEKAAIQAHAERVRDGADAVLAGLNAPKLRAVG